MNLKKMERYLRVNLLGLALVLWKKNLPGRGLTKVEKHCSTHLHTQTIHRTTQNKQYTEQHKHFGRMLAVPRLYGLYPGICLKTEEKSRKNLSQGSRRVLVYINCQNAHITKPIHTHTHALQNPHLHTHPHITKQLKTTIVQVKINTVQDIPKLYSHNIIKHPQYKVNDTFIHKNITVTHFTSLYPQIFTVTHFASLIVSLHKSLHFNNPFTSQITSLH